jgi:predicted nucleic acid-binding protein
VALYLADTSAWNRSTSVADRWHELVEADELALCTPVKLELLWSAEGRGDYSELAHDYAQLPNLPLTRTVADRAERTQSLLAQRSQHRGPNAVDLLVAAIAAEYDAVVLHYDRHFDAVTRATGQPTEWIARRGTLD